MDVAGIEADLAEVTTMLSKATRPNVKSELERVQAKLSAELKSAKDKAAPEKVSAEKETPKQAKPVEAPHKPVPIVVKSAGPWTEITTFGLDLGGYDKPLVTVDVRLKGIEQIPAENVTCDFTESTFDLKVVGLDGVNYRMVKSNLDKDIVVADSFIKVKKNHVIVTLQKVKGEYGYDSWTDLCAKGKRKATSSKKSDNPQGDIMGMMQDLYEDGDDNMKKIIGEAMYKAKRGEKYDPKGDMDTASPMSGLDDI